MTDPTRRTTESTRLSTLGFLVVLVTLLVGLFTWWFLQAREGAGLDSAPLAADADRDPGKAALAAPGEGGRSDLAPARAFGTVGGIEIPVGVRLPGVGTLEGRALDRATGEPLAGVRVDLMPLPPAGAQGFGRLVHLANPGDDLEERVLPVAVTGTDAAGQFRFEGVRAGQYFVCGRGTRHVPDGVSMARVLASGSGGPVDVWLRAGGRVLGRVENPDGSAAGGARMAITAGPTFAIEAARTGDILLLETRADEAGEFVFCGIPAGPDWQVTATGGDFALTHLPDVAVAAGEDTRIVVRTSPGAVIVGRVVSRPESRAGADGGADHGPTSPEPLAGAHVGVVPRGLRDLSYVAEVLEATHAVTDAQGRYQIHHVPPGEVDVLAVAPKHLPAQGPRLLASSAGTLLAEDFELPRGPLVEGRVVDGAGRPLAGAVVRWNMVDLRNFNFDFSFAPLLAQAVEGFDFPRSDADGRFIAGPFAGEEPYRIDISLLGYRGEHVDWDPDSGPRVEVVLRSGGAVEGVVMDSGALEPVTSFRITGRDRIDSELGAPGRRNPYAGAQEVEDPRGRFRVESVASGSASLTFLAPGYFPRTLEGLEVREGETLRGVIVELQKGGVVRGVVRDGQGEPVAGAQVFADAGTEFKADFAQNRRRGQFQGPIPGPDGTMGGPAGRIGRPEDLPAGMGGMLALLGLFGDRSVLTRPDGSFELGGLALGTHTIYASHREYVLARSEPVTLSADTPAPEVSLTLSRGAAIFGTASDRFGRPVKGAIVLALSPANLSGGGNSTGGGIYQGNTDADGRYAIEHVSAGGYFVMLTRGDQGLNPLSFLGTLNFDLVNVPPEERVQFDIVDTSLGACRVSGFVTAAGQPITAGSVAALGFESESLLGVDFKLAQIGADGAFEFVGLAPGEYTFQVTTVERGRAPDRVPLTVEVPDLPEARIDLQLPQGGLEGTVVARDDGQPIEGCDLVLSRDDVARPAGLFGELLSRDNGVARARSGPKGRFRFERLSAGEYRLSLRPPRRVAGGQGLAQPEPRRVVVLEGEVLVDLRLELAPALSLRGAARNTRGDPLEGVEVVATSRIAGALPERAKTDREGRFVIDHLAPGTYDLSAGKDGYAAAHDKGRVLTEAGAEECVLVLSQGVEARVRVLSAQGEPLPGASGRLVSESDAGGMFGDAGRMLSRMFAGQGVSNAQGLLSLGNHDPGKYTLEISRGSLRASRAVELVEGPPVVFTVRME